MSRTTITPIAPTGTMPMSRITIIPLAACTSIPLAHLRRLFWSKIVPAQKMRDATMCGWMTNAGQWVPHDDGVID
eukprot:6027308-Prymnesium_polylepis.1